MKRIKALSIFGAIFLILMSIIFILCNSTVRKMSAVSRPYEPCPYTIIESEQVPLAPTIGANSLEALTLNELNEIRQSQNLNPLTYSENLTQAALVRAKECDDLFSHTRPDGTDWYTVNDAIMFGENLAEGYNDAESLTTAWMNSPAHRELILEDEYETCGVGTFKAADGTVYAAAEFGY